jgi:hypothetical protein
VCDVQLSADEPASAFDAVRGVEHLCPPLRELEAEVGDHLGPEALGLLDGDPVQRVVAGDAEAAHETRHVRALADLCGWPPDEVGHVAKPTDNGFDERC